MTNGKNRTLRWRLFLWLHLTDLLRDSYLGLLGREPDALGLEAYKAELARTRNLAELLTDMAHSDEFWEKMVAVRSAELVDAAFRGLLGREPDAEASAGYAEVLTEKKDISAVLADIVRSDEFWEKMQARRSTELVSEIYKGLLGREPDQEAVRAYAGILSGNRGLSAVLTDIIGTDEFMEKTMAGRSHQFVEEIYRCLLGRSPDPDGMAGYAQVLGATKSLSGVMSALLDSEEFAIYYNRRKNRLDPEAKFEEPCLVFLHIQKTAGTSIQNHLNDCFGHKEFYREHSDSLHIFSPAELSAYDVFAGHFNYDSLRFIPRRKLSIFTFLREPRQRLYSLYHFLRAHEPGHPSFVSETHCTSQNGFQLANQLMIEEFFENPQIRKESGFWNHMCWAVMGQRQWLEWMSLLSGEKDEITVADILDSTIRPAIIQRLREFMFIGLQEDFDRSVQALFRLMEKQPPAEVRADHSLEKLMLTEPHFKKKIEKQPVTPRVDAALDGLIQLDNIVYEEAKKLYAERMAELRL